MNAFSVKQIDLAYNLILILKKLSMPKFNIYFSYGDTCKLILEIWKFDKKASLHITFVANYIMSINFGKGRNNQLYVWKVLIFKFIYRFC